MNRRELFLKTAQVAVGTAIARLSLTQPLSASEVSVPSTGDVKRKLGRVGLRTQDMSDDTLVYLKQIGVDDVLVPPNEIRGYNDDCQMELEDLAAFKQRLEQHGLRYSAMVLDQRILANFLMGRPDGEKDLDKMCRLIEQMGEVGIPLMMYSLLISRAITNTTGKPLPGYETKATGRGGAGMKNFSEARSNQITEEPVGPVSAEVMWQRITRFLERCVPVAEKAKVMLALHPDDPPVAKQWGVHQVLHNLEGLKRAMTIAPSPYNGLLFCQGTIQEAGIDLQEYIRYFGPRGKIAHVEFRGVRGNAAEYTEEFMDQGEQSLWPIVTALQDVGYDGLYEIAHVPKLINDPKRLIVNAWSIAYLKGLLTAASYRPPVKG